MALGQTAGCPRVNRAKKFMCSPRNTGTINFSLWLPGGLSQGCPDPQKSMCSKFKCPFLALTLRFYFVTIYRPGLAIARSPYRAPEPRNPKSAFKSPKHAILDPPEKWPQKSMKMSKKPISGHLNFQKTGFLDILIDFWGHFWGGGVQNGIFRTFTWWTFRIFFIFFCSGEGKGSPRR